MAVRTAFRKYLRFDGTAHAKKPFTLHFGERWVPLLTKLFTTEMVRTDDLAIDRSAAAGWRCLGVQSLRAQFGIGDREGEDRDCIELFRPQSVSPAGAGADRTAALHRKPSRLSPLVYPR